LAVTAYAALEASAQAAVELVDFDVPEAAGLTHPSSTDSSCSPLSATALPLR
jgi:hypothetical protein